MAWHDRVARGPLRRGAGGRVPASEGGARAGPGRRIAAAVVGGLWWLALLRLVVWPQSAGVIEGAVVAGGWGLSLLPVHCVPWVGKGDGANGRGGPARTEFGAEDLRKGWVALRAAYRRWRSGGRSGRA